ncbi:MAG: glucuronate isomerase [Anaerolineae bacterium]|nr:glucuronate isomerase [Anaerolineae bacterium]
MTNRSSIFLPPDRYLGPDPAQKQIAEELYGLIANAPLVCPHGHVDPRLFSDPDYSFGTPTEMIIIPDHYIFRMLYSQGISMESLGIPRQDGGPVEQDHRKIWQTFAENFYLFRGTPTGVWLNYSFDYVFGVEQKLNGETAQAIYDQIADCLQKPAFRPRALFEQFNVEVLTTTDTATDPLEHHQAIRDSGWSGRILPTFRPDAVINLDAAGWRENIDQLGERVGYEVSSYGKFIDALENRRAFFKSMGATATDHAALTPYTNQLSPAEAEAIFQRALQGQASADDARLFTGHMLMEMARMSTEDGLVMQLHPGSLRSHNTAVFERFGVDKGGDIPIQTEYTNNLRPLLTRYGSDPRLTLILFTLDETTYGRELAPLAGHYPAVKLGPPWWFFDSLNGMDYFFHKVSETAGIYNTVGFNDDTRAFPSIPARHDVWRRATAHWVAGLHVRGIVDMEDAEAMMHDLAYNLAKQAYKFN